MKILYNLNVEWLTQSEKMKNIIHNPIKFPHKKLQKNHNKVNKLR